MTSTTYAAAFASISKTIASIATIENETVSTLADHVQEMKSLTKATEGILAKEDRAAQVTLRSSILVLKEKVRADFRSLRTIIERLESITLIDADSLPSLTVEALKVESVQSTLQDLLEAVEAPKVPTVEERFQRAVKAVRKAGYKVRINANPSVYETLTGIFAWTQVDFQTEALKFDSYGNANLYKVAFHFGDDADTETTVLAEEIIQQMKAQGFKVEWRGFWSTAVMVIMK